MLLTVFASPIVLRPSECSWDLEAIGKLEKERDYNCSSQIVLVRDMSLQSCML
jgi:hypothetical protein